MYDDTLMLAELGQDAELLLMPDAWLENERVALQQQLSLLVEQLKPILTAQKFKIQLQQRNRVAVRVIEKTAGQPDVAIVVAPINDAVKLLERDKRDPTIPADVSQENADQQLALWRKDGYDVNAACRN